MFTATPETMLQTTHAVATDIALYYTHSTLISLFWREWGYWASNAIEAMFHGLCTETNEPTFYSWNLAMT